MRKIDSVMTYDLYTLSKNDTLQTARFLMVARHIHHVPIVNKQHELLGLVSHRDILAASNSELEEATKEEVVKNLDRYFEHEIDLSIIE